MIVRRLIWSHIGLLFISVCIASCLNGSDNYKDSIKTSIQGVLPDISLRKFGSKYYYFEAIYEGNYFQGIQFCNYHGMQLLSIETKEENAFLLEQLQRFLGVGKFHFWTSGTILPDGHWVWLSTGNPVEYTSWLLNQPDNAGNNESCIEIRFSHADKVLFWNDHVCSAPKYVVCEMSALKCPSSLTHSFVPSP